MLWDGLIILLFIILAVAGWNVGIINSWRGLPAIIIATLVTQQFYVDFATFVVQQLRVTQDQATVIAYFLMWCGVEILCELLFSVILPFNKKSKPLFFERIAGVVFGLVKAFIIVVLPSIALLGPIDNIPKAPPDKSALINRVDSGVDKSVLIGVFENIGKALQPGLGPLVISTKKPSFTPNFSGNSVLDEENGSSTTTNTSK